MMWRNLVSGMCMIGLASVVGAGCGPGQPERPARDRPTRPTAETPAAQEAAEVEQEEVEEGWGTLKARFVYEDSAPEQRALKITQDVAYCSEHTPLDESLVVNQQNKGVANVLVWLSLRRGETVSQIHPSYEEAAEEAVVLDNKGCRFEPHVQLVRTGQPLQVTNSDPIGHNTKGDLLNNPAFNPTLPAGGSLEVQIQQPERLPARVSCSIHPWMTAWLVVQDHPYMAKTDEDGNLEIANLPSGTWTFQVWHEKAGYITEVSDEDGEPQAWSRGRVEVTVQPGDNDWGQFTLNPAIFD